MKTRAATMTDRELLVAIYRMLKKREEKKKDCDCNKRNPVNDWRCK